MCFRLALLWCALGLTMPRVASAEWTLSGLLGGSSTQRTSLTLTLPAESTRVRLSPVRFRSESLEPPLYYAYRVGIFFHRAIGLEGEFIHMKAVADTAGMANASGVVKGVPTAGALPIASVIERFSITHGLNLVLVNAVVRRTGPASSADGGPRWILSGRLGAGGSVPHPESRIGGVTLERYEWGAFSMQAGAGVEVRLRGPLYGSGEYKLTRTAQDVTVAGGSARTPIVTHHLAVGLSLHLGARPD